MVMGPKRVLSEQEKVKRRQTSREFRAKKAASDPDWYAKEASRTAVSFHFFKCNIDDLFVSLF